MPILGFIIIFSFLGSIGSLIGGFILLAKEKFALKISNYLAAFAAGTLLATAFFDLLPEAAEKGEELKINIFLWALIGFIIFFLLERFIHWYHHHSEHYEFYHRDDFKKAHIIPLITVGDTLHNFIDGVVMGGTFLVNIQLGIITSLAVALHEIPQEIGDFGLMLHQGLPRKKIIIINVVSAAVAMVGAVLTYFSGSLIKPYISQLLSLTAGFFIYIAASDIIPEIHHETKRKTTIYQTLLLLLGIFVVFLAISLLESR